jgi:myo-inositol-1(or 4)-monophosphatase
MPPTPQTPDAELIRSLRALAEQAARAGGAVARGMFRRPIDVELKSDGSEVTAADRAAQAAVESAIKAVRSDDGFIGEEDAVAESATLAVGHETVVWVTDPIDGTRSFVRGLPLYACSVGALIGGHPVAGAVYDPSQEAMFSASVADGFFVDGVAVPPLVSGQGGHQPGSALLAIPSSVVGEYHDRIHRWVDEFVVRNVGSAALHLAYVATGQFDAAILTNCKLWDIAAGYVLVTMAGGRMTTPDGAALFPLDLSKYDRRELPSLAGRGALFEHLLAARRRA